jgi:hypothetical protein
MSAIAEKEFDRNFRPRERHRGLPKLALRQRSADHPMVLFFLIVAIAFAAMALVPPSGAAFAFLGSSPAVSAPALGTEARAASGPGLSETGIACNGQTWGAESVQCLAVIGKEGGVSRAVRVIAGT